MRTLQTMFVALAIGWFVPQASVAQPGPESTPAPVVFNLISVLLGIKPVTSDAEFETISKTLHFYHFHPEANGWSFENATGKVFLAARPSEGTVALILLPSVLERLGDASLAALIARAVSISASEGNVIDLELAPRHLISGGHTGTAVEHIAFYVNGGTWMRTSINVEWSK